MRAVLAFAITVCLAGRAVAADPAAVLRDRALHDPTAWSLVRLLATEVGPRPVGSPAAVRARDWGLAKLKALGFAAVHAEAFDKDSWVRGAESAAVTAPVRRPLAILGLGGSPPTPPGGIEAPVVVFSSYAGFLAAPAAAMKGRIVVVNQPMVRTQDGSGYAAAVASRNGGGEAGQRGALAYLVRSVATGHPRAPHTGSIWPPSAARFPSAALAVPDADLLQRLAARGPVRVRLRLASSTRTGGKAWNVSGEIGGSGNEIVVVGGHLDTWDVGTGAVDDAAGIAITTAAARLIGMLPHPPRRTVRVVMWGSEETGGASDAYVAAHKQELPRIVLAGEADLGADRAWRVALPDRFAALRLPLAAMIAPLDAFVSDEAPQHGGSDIDGLHRAGVPVFLVNQDAGRYFDVHHSAGDTLAAVDRAQLNQNVAVWTSLLYLAAGGGPSP